MSQPEWKYVGHIGDADPIAHGGAFVYTDATGVYGPEMAWFEPGSDQDWLKLAGETPLREYRILLENDATGEWWYDKLADVARFAGQPLAEMQANATSADPLKRAWVYDSLIHYFGPEEFCSDPLTLTEDEAYARYAD